MKSFVKKRCLLAGFGLLGFIFLLGCQAAQKKMKFSFRSPEVEAEWIRNGEPIIFEEELWLPQDSMDVMTDSEVYLLGEYKDVQIFAAKIDVRPYEILYTKFGDNKFRIFKRRSEI